MSSSAPPAASTNELLGLPAVGTGKGQTRMGRATLVRSQQPSLAALLDDVSLHFPLTAFLLIASHSFSIKLIMSSASRWQHRHLPSSWQSVGSVYPESSAALQFCLTLCTMPPMA